MMDPLDSLRKIIDEMRIAMPWVDWAQKNPVHFSLRDDIVESNQALILQVSLLNYRYHLLIHPDLFNRLRQLANRGGEGTWLRLSDQRIAEMIVWFNLEMQEPGEERPKRPKRTPPDDGSGQRKVG